MEHIIKYYPVGNADCSLVKLANGKTILIDCCFREITKDDKGNPTIYDVKADLLSELRKKNGHPYVDLFINTHPHEDHIIGFEKHFYCGKPEDYDDEKDAEKIIIGELWVTPKTLTNDVAEKLSCLRKEAKRRRKLYDDNVQYVGDYGNYLHIIGYDKDKEFDKRYGYVPGQIVEKINGGNLQWLEIFIHAPFKEDVETSKDKDDKNIISIVMQFGFKIEDVKDIVCKAIFAGDAEHPVWTHILENNTDKDRLKWNILLAPHHCSWTFFNSTSNKDEIVEAANKILTDYQIGSNAHIIASSEEIKDNENDPPCYKAMKKYKGKLKNESNFFCTAITNKDEKSIPKPVVYVIGRFGKLLKTDMVKSSESIVSRPAPRAGI